MNKHEYIEMLLQDIETHDDVKRELFKEVIDCAEIALSQTGKILQGALRRSVSGCRTDCRNARRVLYAGKQKNSNKKGAGSGGFSVICRNGRKW